MPRNKKKTPEIEQFEPDPKLLEQLSKEDPLGGIPGPGRWLVIEYEPTALFSLKSSHATSSVGMSLVIPTPYAAKMALVDAAFRVGLSNEECEQFFDLLTKADLRIAPAPFSLVTSTFTKIRQGSRVPTRDKKKQTEEEYRRSLVRKLCSGHPSFLPEECEAFSIEVIKQLIESTYDSTIAYRELVYVHGVWRCAFDLLCGGTFLAERLALIAPCIGYLGKRGSFIQFRTFYRKLTLGADFTQPLLNDSPLVIPIRSHVRQLDDFGPQADLNILSSFTLVKPKPEKHRRFVPTIIPVGIVNTGPNFCEYRSE